MRCAYETPESHHAACNGGEPCGKGPLAFCESCDFAYCGKHLKVCADCGHVFCHADGEIRCFVGHVHNHMQLASLELELARGRQIA